jgi:hypothetical protein
VTRGDDRISGYLDGELSGEEKRTFEHDLDADPTLRDQLDEIASVRDRLRAMGSVEAPLGFFDRILTRERRHRRVGVLAGVVALAAALLVVVSATPVAQPLEFVPGVDQLVAQHATASPDMSTMSSIDDVEQATMLDEADMAAMDLSMRHAVHTSNGTDWVQYERVDGTRLSVFSKPGSLELSEMPDDAEVMSMGDEQAFMMKREGRDVLVAQHDSTVFTVIADDHDDMMDTMGHRLPDESMGIGDHLSNAAMVVIDLFSFN